MDQPTHKACSKCGETKPLTDYGVKSAARDGRNSRCKPCVKVDKAESWQRHLESNRAKNRANYLAHREARIAGQAAWKKANPDKVREYGRIWRERNPGRDTEDTRRWIAENPERAAVNFKRNTLKRRARKKNATIGVVNLDALWSGSCGICDEPIDRATKYPHPLSPSVDHIVPLSKGGTHEQSNLQWAHLVCNQRKGAKAS